jgi:hypothetical protein
MKGIIMTLILLSSLFTIWRLRVSDKNNNNKNN